MATSNFWLVKTGSGTAEVQNFPPGIRPPGAHWQPGLTGSAIYVGSTPEQVNQYIAQASRQLGVPNPQNVPSLGTSLGIIGAIFAGAGAAAGAASDVGAAADAGAAGAGGGAAAVGRGARVRPGGQPSTGSGGGASINPKLAKAGLLGAAAAAITGPLDFLKFIAWIFHPRNILRAVEFITGFFLFYVGLKASFDLRPHPSIGRITRTLAADSPIGRAQRMAQGRRAGRHEGETEHARLEARRKARAKASGNNP